MKIFAYLLLLIFTVLFSTGRIFSSKIQTQKYTTDTSNITEINKQANSIVNATSIVIDLYNEQMEVLEKVEDALEQSERNIAVLIHEKEHSSIIVPMSICQTFAISGEKLEKYESSFAKAASFTQKDEIISGINSIQTDIPRLNVCCRAMHEYWEEEIYRVDDTFEQFKKLYDSLDAVWEDIFSCWHKTVALATDAYDSADLSLIRWHPVAEFLIPMKMDFINLRKFIWSFQHDTIDYEAYQQTSDSLEMVFIRNSRLDNKDTSKLNDVSSVKGYLAVYEGYKHCLNKASVLLQRCNPEDNIYKSEEERTLHFDKYYTELMDEFNNTIHLYNSFKG
jgi:hypothetical protein